MQIRRISVTFILTVHSFYECVQSNQSNTLDREKPSQQEQTFCLQCSSLFLHSSASSLLKKEFIDNNLGKLNSAVNKEANN